MLRLNRKVFVSHLRYCLLHHKLWDSLTACCGLARYPHISCTLVCENVPSSRAAQADTVHAASDGLLCRAFAWACNQERWKQVRSFR